MEESNSKSASFEDLYEMYVKIKVEIKCQFNNGDINKQHYFESILKCIEDKLQSAEKDSEVYMKLQAMKASLFYEHAKIIIAIQDPNEKLCLQLLRDALAFIEDYKLNCQITYLYFRIINILAYTLSKLNKFEEARQILENAEVLYNPITDSEKTLILVYNTDEIFQNVHVLKGNSTVKFEKLITNNFQIQAWIYNKLNISKKFLKYHHIVLNRQLETQDGSALVWFYKCARLGVYFFSNNKFTEGKHHLIAAGTVLREYELELLKHRSEPHFITEWNGLKKYYADLGKYWSKYGLFLFNASRHLAVAQLNSVMNLNEVLIHSFQESANYGPAREWFNIKKNSAFFPTTKKISKTQSNIDKQNHAQQSYKHLVGELHEQKQKESETDIAFPSNIDEKPKTNLENNIQQEIVKLNEEVEKNESEEITEVTKMIINALDDRQKEVETNKHSVEEEKNTKENDTANSTVKIEEKTDADQTSESDIKESKKGSSESIKSGKEAEKQDSRTSNTSSTSSKNEDDSDYEFKFPSIDQSEFSEICDCLINSTEQARKFFFYIQEWVKRAKYFYTIQEHPCDYVHLILDLNELYYYMSMYETEIDSQYDVLRRRTDILESVSTLMKEMRPQEYLFLSVELLQELAQAQIDLLMLNLRRITSAQSSGNLLLKDICQEHNDVSRKVEAMTEIQRRLGRRESKITLIDKQLFG